MTAIIIALMAFPAGWIAAMAFIRATYHLEPKMMSEAEAAAFFDPNNPA